MDQFSSSFEHESLETDIRRLAQEVKAHKDRPENKRLSGQELLKKAIQSLPSVGSASAIMPVSKSPLPAYAESAPADVKLEIEYLLDTAFHHGILKADAEARKSSPFVLDAFHDALAGKLYPEFQKRGLLK